MTRTDAEAVLDLMRQPDAIAEGRAKLESALGQFEAAWGMSTTAMRRAVVRGDLPETEEVIAWLMVANRLQLLNEQHPPTTEIDR